MIPERLRQAIRKAVEGDELEEWLHVTAQRLAQLLADGHSFEQATERLMADWKEVQQQE